MKKWLLAFPVLLILIVLILPSEKHLDKSFMSGFPHNVVLRMISDTTGWRSWWPGEKVNDSTYTIGDKAFTKGPVLMSSFSAKEKKGDLRLSVQYLPQTGNRTSFNVASSISFSKNPFRKAAQYIEIMGWKKSFDDYADSLEANFSNTERLYGFKIEHQKVPNPAYISVTQEFTSVPSWDTVYSLIDEIKNYVASSQAQVVNDPIFHMIKVDDKWMVMVAVATNRVLPSSGKFQLKQMILGNILVSEVRGGPGKIAQCEQAMELYVRDYGKASPAIPFQRLITDRRKVQDTSLWITRVNYPVFE